MPQPRPAKEALFFSNFITYGIYNGEPLVNGTFTGNPDGALAHIYYDMSWVMWKLKDYFDSLNDARAAQAAAYALAADDWYLQYLIPANYNAQGFRNFVDGFEQSWLRLAQANKKTAAITLSQNAAYARDGTPLSETEDWTLSREVSYAVRSYFCAERLGEAVRTRRDQLIAQIFGHFDQWFVTQTAAYVKTFMVGLSSRALVDLYFKPGTSAATKTQIVTALTIAADWLWANMWVATAEAFRYQSVDDPTGTRDPAPDLNQLITPMYGFLWYVTGDIRHQQRHHDAFNGGVMVTDSLGFWQSGAYIFGGKQFNQHYWWSLQGLTLATSDPLTQGGGGDPPGNGGSGNIIPALLGEGFPAILAPVAQKSWEQHFFDNSWSTIEQQINAGFQLFIQPVPLTAEFLERIDVGVVIPAGTVISLEYSPIEFDGAVTITPTIGYSLTDGGYTDTVGVTQVLAGSFRYLKIRLQFAASSNKSLVRIPEMRIKISAKEIRDGGSGSALATDYTVPSAPEDKGTRVDFTKSFIDINQLQVTARYQSGLASGGQAIAYHNFQDIVSPIFFRVFILNSVTGAAIDGAFDWSAKGV